MAMAVYDDKSDHDNPFVEPLFDLIIHKAKVSKTDPFTLFIKTKSMHFTIETNSEVNDSLKILLEGVHLLKRLRKRLKVDFPCSVPRKSVRVWYQFNPYLGDFGN